jgi:hypothetical protein
MSCDTGDFRYPLQAHLYYPIVEQSAYGNIDKQWNFDRNIHCSLVPAGSGFKEEIDPDVLLSRDQILVGRFKEDIRNSSFGESFETTNILITNVVDKSCNLVYRETGGPRSEKGTLFEVATLQPFLNPFGRIEYYKVILKRSENQGANL